jgi:outer membrane lipoprotein carrier protein
VWLYLPSTSPGQVIKAPLTADIEGSIDLIGAFFVNPRSQYTVTDAGAATVGSHSTRALALVPRKAGASFVRAKIWVDTNDGLLRQFEAVEHSGITRRVRVIDYAPNASVATSAFSFKPPKGVKVVDGASLR